MHAVKYQIGVTQTFNQWQHSFQLKAVLSLAEKLVSAPCHVSTIGSPYLVLTLFHHTWWQPWCHQMETFSVSLAICAGNSPVPGEFPAQRPVTLGLDVFFDLHLNKLLRKQLWGWWFETLSCPLWRHCNEEDLCLIWNTVTFTLTLTWKTKAKIRH